MRLTPLLLVLALSACGAKNAENPADAGSEPGTDASQQAGSDAATPGTDGGTSSPDAGLPDPNVLSLKIGPLNLAPQEERTVCTVFKLPTTDKINVVKMAGTLAKGSHHLIFYRSASTTEDKPLHDCQGLDVGGGDIPLYIMETETNNELPLPTGVAYEFQPGEMVKIEAHYYNPSDKGITGLGTINLTKGMAASYQKADIMFCGSVSGLYFPGIPPGDSSLAPGFFKIPDGLKFFGLTTHQHKRGRQMVLEKATNASTPGTLLVDGQPYDNPPFKIYGDNNLLTFGPGEGIRWQCHYRNTGTLTYRFGQSAEDNEMCFFWGYYFPSAGRFINTECQR